MTDEYITIPYSNSSQNIMDGWLVSSSTDVPTKMFTHLGGRRRYTIYVEVKMDIGEAR